MGVPYSSPDSDGRNESRKLEASPIKCKKKHVIGVPVLHARSCRTDGTVHVHSVSLHVSGVPRNFFRWGVQQIQLRTEDRENGDLGGGSTLVRVSGGSCNLVQEISFHMVKFS